MSEAMSALNPWPYCANDGTCSCAKFHDDPEGCERRAERGTQPPTTNGKEMIVTDELSLPPEAERELEAMAQASGPPEGYEEAGALHHRIRAIVEERNADIRELIGRKFDDMEWKVRGGPLVAIFMGLEVQLDMLKECPSSTLVHFIGFSTVHVHHLVAQMLGIEVGSANHIAAVAIVSAVMESRFHAGPQSVQ